MRAGEKCSDDVSRLASERGATGESRAQGRNEAAYRLI